MYKEVNDGGGRYFKIIQLQDKSFVGIGTDNQVYSKKTIDAVPIKDGVGLFLSVIQYQVPQKVEQTVTQKHLVFQFFIS